MAWSPAALSVWGKTASYDAEASMPLVQHLLDSAQVAGHVWDWLPPLTRLHIEENLPESARDGRVLLRCLAGVHDIGKCSAPFASQVPFLADRMREHGLIPPRDVTDFGKAKHGMVGQLVLERWLAQRFGASPKAARTYAVIVGGHHGVPPTVAKLEWLADRPYLLGDRAWIDIQDEILDRMAEETGADQHLPAWATHRLEPTSQAVLTGAVIVADWLASNTDLFPFTSSIVADRAGEAWQEVSLPPPWSPSPPPDDVAMHFSQRFANLGPQPRPVQRVAAEVAHRSESPPLLIIEAGMGSGKTEAALLAAETLAERFGCGGVFFGLPTMATSDGMFGRILDWIGRLDGAAALSTFLAHGKAGLNDQFRGLMRADRLARVHDEDAPPHAEARVASWLTGRKKGVLATMVVGTVDQLLFLSLQAKHAALRHLGFSGKVVVVDEVHAADDYMRMYLCRALEWLAAYGVPVVLLSATLPSGQRQQLADAYRAGVGLPPAPLSGAAPYPLVTAVSAQGVESATPQQADASTTVELRAVDDDLETLGRTLDEWLIDGGCIAVIRNTVSRAQAAYDWLVEKFGDAVVLHHSRFLATHRAAREAVLRSELGPDGTDRPSRRIVVGTQVLEQSLDVDFDAMVTDLAPVDLVLQRIGRLHRHTRPRPEALRHPTVVVTGITGWDADGIPEFDAGSRAVYGLSRLIRAAGALGLVAGSPTTLTLPDDIRSLVETAYGVQPPVPDAWLPAAANADEVYERQLDMARVRADQFRMRPPSGLKGSLVGWLEDSSTEAEDGASQGSARVRDGEDGIEVIVTQKVGGEVTVLNDGSRHAGKQLPTDLDAPSPDVARALAAMTVRLPVSMTRSAVDFDRVLSALEANAYEGWQQSPWLAGQLILHLDETWRASVAGWELAYDLDRGLVATKEGTP